MRKTIIILIGLLLFEICLPKKIKGQFQTKCQIQILVGYSQEVVLHAGGEGKLLRRIQAAIFELNNIYISSGVHHHLKLVRTINVTEGEKNCNWKDLSSFAKNSKMTDLMDKYNADIGVLLISNSEGCGSYLNNGSVAEKATAYCAVNYDCMEGNYSLPHMIAHLYGCGHIADPPNSEIKPFNFDHGFNWFWSESANFLTIMGVDDETNCSSSEWYPQDSNNCSIIPHFSNPSINYIGVPTGDPEFANNAEVLNQGAKSLSEIRLIPSHSIIKDTISSFEFAILMAVDSINTTNIFRVNNKGIVTFSAGEKIILNSGFQVEEGAYFEAIPNLEAKECK